MKRCENKNSIKGKNYCKQGKMMMPIPKNVSKGLHEGVLINMRDDDVLRLIRNDPIIISYGERNYYFKKDALNIQQTTSVDG